MPGAPCSFNTTTPCPYLGAPRFRCRLTRAVQKKSKPIKNSSYAELLPRFRKALLRNAFYREREYVRQASLRLIAVVRHFRLKHGDADGLQHSFSACS